MSISPTQEINKSGWLQVAARISWGSSFAFILLLTLLHFLKPELDPSWRFISEYELGAYGWVMQLAFFCLTLSCATLVVAIFQDARTIAGYIGMGLVLLAAFGMALAGVFVPDEVNRLHEVGAMLDHLPFGAILINWSLARKGTWDQARTMLATTAFIPLLGLILFIGSMILMLPQNEGKPGPNVLVGWPNRIMILAHCAWIIPLGRYAELRMKHQK